MANDFSNKSVDNERFRFYRFQPGDQSWLGVMRTPIDSLILLQRVECWTDWG